MWTPTQLSSGSFHILHVPSRLLRLPLQLGLELSNLFVFPFDLFLEVSHLLL